MVIWIESKNPTLYSGGISAWTIRLLESLSDEQKSELVIVGPNLKKSPSLLKYGGGNVNLFWPTFLPRKVNHLLYNHLSFRLAALLFRPQLIFSPYYDVAFPKRIPFIITIHDLCFLEVPEVYSYLELKYHVWLLKRNLKRAQHVITVSESSKKSIVAILGYSSEKISVIRNHLSSEFQSFSPSEAQKAAARDSFGNSQYLILYTSGLENRKNIGNLLKGLLLLDEEGIDFSLLISGDNESGWSKELIDSGFNHLVRKIKFLGFLSESELKVAYTVADLVVCPSLSEGFGRPCLESMSTGTPLACSDIPVFREIASNYALFFNPRDPHDIAQAMKKALLSGRQTVVSDLMPTDTDEAHIFWTQVIKYKSQA